MVHGEDSVCTAFAECLMVEYTASRRMRPTAVLYLTWQRAGLNTRRTVFPLKEREAGYRRLCKASFRRQRLLTGIIKKNEGTSNKDMAKFADQIIASVTSGIYKGAKECRNKRDLQKRKG